MTTFTVDTSIEFPQTHFKTMDEFAMYIAQWNFEKQLDEGAERVRNKPLSSFINI